MLSGFSNGPSQDVCLGVCCANTGLCIRYCATPVAETDEDPAGSFDGIWQVVINKAPGIQYGPGNWTLNCNGAESEMRLAVQDSVIRMGFESRYRCLC